MNTVASAHTRTAILLCAEGIELEWESTRREAGTKEAQWQGQDVPHAGGRVPAAGSGLAGRQERIDDGISL